MISFFFFFQAEDGIRDHCVTGVQTCALPILAPLSGMPGTVTALTVAGRGLAGATALTFLRDNAADASVTATNLSVSPDGNRVIADVTIASGAPSGARVVRVVTPDGTSTAAGTGGNVFTIP